MSFPIGIDVASYQPSSFSFFEGKKKLGASFSSIKLTEGTNYLNPKAGAQISNSLKVFGQASVYHFFHGSGVAEAKYFIYWTKKMGLDKTTVMILDVELQSLPYNVTSEINTFIRTLKAYGYNNYVTYASGSWFNSGRINRSSLINKNIWVAAYGTDRPGVNNANAWQFTDNWKGTHVDASYDFDGSLSGKRYESKHSSNKKAKPSYSNKNGLYEVIGEYVNVYGTLALDKKNQRRSLYKKGSRIYAKAVKYGSIYRLKLAGTDNYITANKAYVKCIRETK